MLEKGIWWDNDELLKGNLFEGEDLSDIEKSTTIEEWNSLFHFLKDNARFSAGIRVVSDDVLRVMVDFEVLELALNKPDEVVFEKCQEYLVEVI